MFNCKPKKVFDQIEHLADDYLSWLQKLVAIPSTTGVETNAQRLVENRLRDLGVFERLVFVVSDDHASSRLPQYWPTGRHEMPDESHLAGRDEFFMPWRPYLERPCVIGRLGKGEASVFVLNAHIDTAPVENSGSWTYPPFAGHIENGRLYGRGSLDDKAGIAMMLMIAEAFLRADVVLPGSLVLESVIEDEDSGNGTLACLRAGYTCDAAIAIDGTWPYRIIDAHLGQLWINAEICGVPAAACSCSRGQNPLDVATEVVAAWRKWSNECNTNLPVWENIKDPCFVNLGILNGGKWAGAVPETASFSVQIGFTPPWTPDSVFFELKQIANRVIHAFQKAELSLHPGALGTPPFANRNNQLAHLLEKTIRERCPEESRQQQLRRIAVTGHCDLRHLRRADGLPADAVLYGPGGGGNPHIKDEYYDTSHFVPVAQNIAATVLNWFKIQ